MGRIFLIDKRKLCDFFCSKALCLISRISIGSKIFEWCEWIWIDLTLIHRKFLTFISLLWVFKAYDELNCAFLWLQQYEVLSISSDQWSLQRRFCSLALETCQLFCRFWISHFFDDHYLIKAGWAPMSAKNNRFIRNSWKLTWSRILRFLDRRMTKTSKLMWWQSRRSAFPAFSLLSQQVFTADTLFISTS